MVEYDRFKHRTAYRLREAIKIRHNIAGHNPKIFHVQASASCEGEYDCAPQEVLLICLSRSSEWQFLEQHELDLIVDGRRMNLGKTLHEGDPQGGAVNESTALPLTLDVFREIAWADTVEARLGWFEFSFDRTTLTPMRALADTLSALQSRLQPVDMRKI